MQTTDLAALDAAQNAEMAAQEAEHRRAVCARDGHDWGGAVLVTDEPYPAGHECRRCHAVPL